MLLVAKRPTNFLALVEAGVPIKTLLVGKLSQTDKTRSLTKSINVVDTHITTFKLLDAHGVHYIAQMVPGHAAAHFMYLLKKG